MEPGESLIVTPGAVLGLFYLQRYRFLTHVESGVEMSRLGIPVRREGNRINYAYPIAILAARCE